MNRLLEAATEIFSRVGFDRATTRMIAKRAKVNEALINRYFEGKNGLLAAVTQRFLQERQKTYDYPAQDTVEQELELFATRQFDYETANTDLVRVTISRCAVDRRFCQRIREKLPESEDKILEDRLAAAQARGELRADLQPAEVARNVRFQIFSSVFLQYIILGIDRETVLASLKSFCREYARGLRI